MRFASAVSDDADLDVAISAIAAALRRAMAQAPIDLLIVAVTPHHAARWATLAANLRGALRGTLAASTCVIGGSGVGVVGDGHEVEQRCGLSVLAAHLPGVTLQPFTIAPTALPAADSDDDRDEVWAALLPAPDAAPPAAVLLFSEPYAIDTERLVGGLGRGLPGVPLVGGVVSGAAFVGGSALLLDDELHSVGAVGVAMRGAIEVLAVVAQGCRAISHPILISKAEGSTIHCLDDKRPIDVLRAVYESLEPVDRTLFRSALLVGVEMEPERLHHAEGAMLMRHLRGVDADDGSLRITAEVEPWQVVQFHVRDRRTAHDDLVLQLERVGQVVDRERLRGAWMATCVGRGLELYGRPDHDTDLVREQFGLVPLAGCFCAGEIGPVGGRSFVHAYTTVIALFCEPAGPGRAGGGSNGGSNGSSNGSSDGGNDGSNSATLRLSDAEA